MFKNVVGFIKSLYPDENPVPLHIPRFAGNEKQYLNKCIDSTFVSYVGEFVTLFEDKISEFTGCNYAIATVNGTTALHASLILCGVKSNDEILTQALTFVATVNAIKYCNADPVFIDVDENTMGLSPEKLEEFLKTSSIIKDDGFTYNKITNKRISACIPMHTFGHPLRIKKVVKICNKYNIKVIEDSAESLGSFYDNKHTGIFGNVGILSFNGNKIITTGGGGMIITNDEVLAKRARHITTTAKIKHSWEFVHDEIGYNYRMPNVNAAIGCAQLEKLDEYLKNKKELSELYSDFFEETKFNFFKEPDNSNSNYWLNCIIMDNKKERDNFLKYTNENGVMTRPIWRLMNKLDMYKTCQTSDLSNSVWFEERVVNIPSSVRF